MIQFLLLTVPLFASTLNLEVGRTKSLNLPPDAKIQVGSKKILRAMDQGDQLLLVGKAVGSTSLSINGKEYDIQVLSSGSEKFADDLKAWIQDKKGITLETSKGQLKLGGQLLIFKDWLEISELAAKHSGKYQFDAKPIAEALTEATSYFKRKTKDLGLPPFQLQAHTPLSVQIKSNDKAAFTRAKNFFENFGIQVDESKSVLEIRPLVRTSVILAEVSRSVSSSFGLEFPSAESAQILPKFQGPESLMVSLKALESKGLGRVLASPTLNCRSGAEAEFHSGGEFPIRLASYRRQDVQWKKHGVVLKVKPIADAMGAMQIQVETEISLVDTKQLVDGLPAMKTNRVNSAFDLTQKTTIALSGLIQETWGRSQSGLFGLSQIPVLGALFRSEEFLNHKSELVVFVTPEVVEPEKEGASIQWPKHWSNDEL